MVVGKNHVATPLKKVPLFISKQVYIEKSIPLLVSSRKDGQRKTKMPRGAGRAAYAVALSKSNVSR
jgi:hypothetical protein